MIPADVTRELDPEVAAEVAAAALLAAFDRQVAALRSPDAVVSFAARVFAGLQHRIDSWDDDPEPEPTEGV